MKEVQLTKGYVALVDDQDYDRVSLWSWSVNIIKRSDGTESVYAKANISGSTVYLHRFIVGDTHGLHIDHIDRNALNNTRKNLRLCTHSQNMMNRCKMSGASSIYKGVSWEEHSGKWRSRIFVSGKSVSLGLFISENEAAEAYNKAAVKYFGEYAPVNMKNEHELSGLVTQLPSDRDRAKSRKRLMRRASRLVSQLNLTVKLAGDNGLMLSVIVSDNVVEIK